MNCDYNSVHPDGDGGGGEEVSQMDDFSSVDFSMTEFNIKDSLDTKEPSEDTETYSDHPMLNNSLSQNNDFYNKDVTVDIDIAGGDDTIESGRESNTDVVETVSADLKADGDGGDGGSSVAKKHSAQAKNKKECYGDGMTCAECGKTFSHTFYFGTHITSHMGEKNYTPVGQCGMCGLVFADVVVYQAHMMALQSRLDEMANANAERQESKKVKRSDGLGQQEKFRSGQRNDNIRQKNQPLRQEKKQIFKGPLLLDSPKSQPQLNPSNNARTEPESTKRPSEPSSPTSGNEDDGTLPKKRIRRAPVKFECLPEVKRIRSGKRKLSSSLSSPMVSSFAPDCDPEVERYLQSLKDMGLTVDPDAFGVKGNGGVKRGKGFSGGRGSGKVEVMSGGGDRGRGSNFGRGVNDSHQGVEGRGAKVQSFHMRGGGGGIGHFGAVGRGGMGAVSRGGMGAVGRGGMGAAGRGGMGAVGRGGMGVVGRGGMGAVGRGGMGADGRGGMGAAGRGGMGAVGRGGMGAAGRGGMGAVGRGGMGAVGRGGMGAVGRGGMGAVSRGGMGAVSRGGMGAGVPFKDNIKKEVSRVDLWHNHANRVVPTPTPSYRANSNANFDGVPRKDVPPVVRRHTWNDNVSVNKDKFNNPPYSHLGSFPPREQQTVYSHGGNHHPQMFPGRAMHLSKRLTQEEEDAEIVSLMTSDLEVMPKSGKQTRGERLRQRQERLSNTDEPSEESGKRKIVHYTPPKEEKSKRGKGKKLLKVGSGLRSNSRVSEEALDKSAYGVSWNVAKNSNVDDDDDVQIVDVEESSILPSSRPLKSFPVITSVSGAQRPKTGSTNQNKNSPPKVAGDVGKVTNVEGTMERLRKEAREKVEAMIAFPESVFRNLLSTDQTNGDSGDLNSVVIPIPSSLKYCGEDAEVKGENEEWCVEERKSDDEDDNGRESEKKDEVKHEGGELEEVNLSTTGEAGVDVKKRRGEKSEGKSNNAEKGEEEEREDQEEDFQEGEDIAGWTVSISAISDSEEEASEKKKDCKKVKGEDDDGGEKNENEKGCRGHATEEVESDEKNCGDESMGGVKVKDTTKAKVKDDCEKEGNDERESVEGVGGEKDEIEGTKDGETEDSEKIDQGNEEEENREENEDDSEEKEVCKKIVEGDRKKDNVSNEDDDVEEKEGEQVCEKVGEDDVQKNDDIEGEDMERENDDTERVEEEIKDTDDSYIRERIEEHEGENKNDAAVDDDDTERRERNEEVEGEIEEENAAIDDDNTERRERNDEVEGEIEENAAIDDDDTERRERNEVEGENGEVDTMIDDEMEKVRGDQSEEDYMEEEIEDDVEKKVAIEEDQFGVAGDEQEAEIRREGEEF